MIFNLILHLMDVLIKLDIQLLLVNLKTKLFP